jgi:hypothetical protein
MQKKLWIGLEGWVGILEEIVILHQGLLLFGEDGLGL